MPRKRYLSVQQRLENYLKDYNLEDVNKSNDLSTLTQLCQLELKIEQLNDGLSRTNAESNSSKWRSLTSSLKDLTNASVALQESAGLNRKKRIIDEERETVVDYIETLRKQAKTIIDKRLKKIVCPCNQVIGKYHFYILEDGEVGAIAWKDKPLRKMPFMIKAECSKCHSIVIVDESGITRTEDNVPA